MDSLISFGVSFITAFQSLGTWLEAPMKFFSFLGSENFFLLFLPFIYWCVDAALGPQAPQASGAHRLLCMGLFSIF